LPAILIATLFLAVTCGLAATRALPIAVPVVYITASLASFIAYAIDKSAAERGAWRTRERTLHILAVIGGWPGALVAQTVLRHKSRKVTFRFAFWSTVALNCAALIWFCYRAW
jgi:uncharacterized membrane protein YsdA (DUF1294 family)